MKEMTRKEPKLIILLGKVTLGVGMALVACASIPRGTEYRDNASARQTFEQFVDDDAICRDFARRQLGAKPR